MRGILNMVGRLADNVQVRKEGWGLLFYLPAQHRVYFVKSGDWLYPQHFDGTWSSGRLVGDIAKRLGTPVEIIERSIQRLTTHLIRKGLIVNEPC